MLFQNTVFKPNSSYSNTTHYEKPTLTLVAVDTHGSIPLVIPGSSGVWTVHGDLVIVGTQPVMMSIRVRVQSTLQQVMVGGNDITCYEGVMTFGNVNVLTMMKAILTA